MATQTTHTHHLKVSQRQYEFGDVIQDDTNPENMDGRLLEAQSKIEELTAKRQELERLKQEAEQLDLRRRELISSQTEVADLLTATLTRIDRGIFELRKEADDLDQCRSCFTSHLNKLNKITPERWTHEQLAERIDRALSLVESAEDDYSQAADHFAHTRSTAFFSGARSRRVYSGEFYRQMVRGFAFNLPVLILGIVALLIYFYH